MDISQYDKNYGLFIPKSILGNNILVHTRWTTGYQTKYQLMSLNNSTGKQNWLRGINYLTLNYGLNGVVYLAADRYDTKKDNVLYFLNPLTGKYIISKVLPKNAVRDYFSVLKNGNIAVIEDDYLKSKTNIQIFNPKGILVSSKVINEGRPLETMGDLLTVKTADTVSVYDLNTYKKIFTYSVPQIGYSIGDNFSLIGQLADGTILAEISKGKTDELILKAFSSEGKEKAGQIFNIKEYRKKYLTPRGGLELKDIVKISGNSYIIQKGNTLYSYDSNNKLISTKVLNEFSDDIYGL